MHPERRLEPAHEQLPSRDSEKAAEHRERHETGKPAQPRRAEAFMHTHAALTIQCRDVAAAAGCSVRTLEETFKRFRDTTPLRALHAIRLENVRADLHADQTHASAVDIARRYGFTNAARFATAYRCRFGEQPTRLRQAR